MRITRQIKLLPTTEQEQWLTHSAQEYIGLVNAILDYADGQGSMPELTSASVKADLPSVCKNQCIRDAKSIYKKYCKARFDTSKAVGFPVLQKPVVIWNNQNYKVSANGVSFPVMLNGKSTRITVKAVIPCNLYEELSQKKLGSLRITLKNRKWVAQIAIDEHPSEPACGGTMGVDLGIKCPAVCYTDEGKARFFGNGRKNKQMRRHFYSQRKRLGKAKKFAALKKSKNKEQRIMRDIDHKLSRQIVNFAVENHIATIKLETLANIRKAARKSRKNNREKASWSFYRLAGYIEYKAKLLGIKVVYVNPAYTSQSCRICGTLNHADDRDYKCTCGYHGHRDLVGAINICNSTETSGKRVSA